MSASGQAVVEIVPAYGDPGAEVVIFLTTVRVFRGRRQELALHALDVLPDIEVVRFLHSVALHGEMKASQALDADGFSVADCMVISSTRASMSPDTSPRVKEVSA